MAIRCSDEDVVDTRRDAAYMPLLTLSVTDSNRSHIDCDQPQDWIFRHQAAGPATRRRIGMVSTAQICQVRSAND